MPLVTHNFLTLEQIVKQVRHAGGACFISDNRRVTWQGAFNFPGKAEGAVSFKDSRTGIYDVR